ncbi:hypothetical protein NBEOAGPD_1088 [Methylobacterium gregans]|uniref:Uncharacterized protein n=1 Tax=Methylobacterium gregans TaxID=374424 RepID=A0AA37HLD8_9HYPH|nr:hypothetical protein NBEOAGPD_1088 [Methylobacterium gregans]
MRDLVHRRGGLLNGGELLLDGGRLLLRGGADLGGRRVEVGGRGAVGAGELGQPRDHLVQRAAEPGDLVAAAVGQFAREIARADLLHEAHHPLQRPDHGPADQDGHEDAEQGAGGERSQDRQAARLVDALHGALARGDALVERVAVLLDAAEHALLDAVDVGIARLDRGGVARGDRRDLRLAGGAQLAEQAGGIRGAEREPLPDRGPRGREGGFGVALGGADQGGQQRLGLPRGCAPAVQRTVDRLRVGLAREDGDHRVAALEPHVARPVGQVVELARHREIAGDDRVGRLAHRADLADGVEAQGDDHHRDGDEAEEDPFSDRERQRGQGGLLRSRSVEPTGLWRQGRARRRRRGRSRTTKSPPADSAGA